MGDGISFGWGQRYKIKNASHKKWYYTIFSQKLPEWKGGFWGAFKGRRPARRVGGRQKERVYAAKWY